MHTIALNVSQMHTNRKERMGDFTWKVSDCEELVGFLTGDEEVFLGGMVLYISLSHTFH